MENDELVRAQGERGTARSGCATMMGRTPFGRECRGRRGDRSALAERASSLNIGTLSRGNPYNNSPDTQ
jgi:hypothetical protein